MSCSRIVRCFRIGRLARQEYRIKVFTLGLLRITFTQHKILSIALRIPAAHDFRVISVQNVTDFPQNKLDCEINAPFLLNEHGDSQIFFQVFTKNNLIKKIFEEEKKFDSRTLFWEENRCILAKARTSS